MDVNGYLYDMNVFFTLRGFRPRQMAPDSLGKKKFS
jgi:hypothetical protein